MHHYLPLMLHDAQQQPQPEPHSQLLMELLDYFDRVYVGRQINGIYIQGNMPQFSRPRWNQRARIDEVSTVQSKRKLNACKTRLNLSVFVHFRFRLNVSSPEVSAKCPRLLIMGLWLVFAECRARSARHIGLHFPFCTYPQGHVRTNNDMEGMHRRWMGVMHVHPGMGRFIVELKQ